MSKLVLILNCGSSSLKFAILDPATGEEKLSGLAEAFYLPEARIKWKLNGEKGSADLGAGAAHTEALNFIASNIMTDELKNSITSIGHRIVHGGEKYTQSVVVTDEVVKGIEDAAQFAPLHNPAHLIGIREAFKTFPHLKDKNVVVFDTAFHQSMPEENYIFPLPYEYYTNDKVRRYGAHGTSHEYLTKRLAELQGKTQEEMNIITCHLGNGASITAVKNGKSYKTSMGFTPLGGIMMGTRCGDIDPAIVPFLENKYGYTPDEMDTIMNKKSGMLGVSGISSDGRDIEAAVKEGNPRAILTQNVYVNRIVEVVSGYYGLMGGADAIVFAGGIGENDCAMRQRICDGLSAFGVVVKPEDNDGVRGVEKLLSAPESKMQVWLLPTNEELVIARDAYKDLMANA